MHAQEYEDPYHQVDNWNKGDCLPLAVYTANLLYVLIMVITAIFVVS